MPGSDLCVSDGLCYSRQHPKRCGRTPIAFLRERQRKIALVNLSCRSEMKGFMRDKVLDMRLLRKRSRIQTSTGVTRTLGTKLEHTGQA